MLQFFATAIYWRYHNLVYPDLFKLFAIYDNMTFINVTPFIDQNKF